MEEFYLYMMAFVVESVETQHMLFVKNKAELVLNSEHLLYMIFL